MDSNLAEPTPTTSGSDLDESHSGSSQRVWLNRISTRWTAVNNPTLFVKRYGRAIRKYVATLIHDPLQIRSSVVAAFRKALVALLGDVEQR